MAICSFPMLLLQEEVSIWRNWLKLKKQGIEPLFYLWPNILLGDKFKINREADKLFYETFQKAINEGVEAYAYSTKDSIGIYELDKKIKLIKG